MFGKQEKNAKKSDKLSKKSQISINSCFKFTDKKTWNTMHFGAHIASKHR